MPACQKLQTQQDMRYCWPGTACLACQWQQLSSQRAAAALGLTFMSVMGKSNWEANGRGCLLGLLARQLVMLTRIMINECEWC